MAVKTWQTDADHPALVEWLGRHQDEELQTLTATYKAADGKLRAHMGRREEAEKRLLEIDRLLVDAGAKERASLLTKRAELAADLASLPTAIETLRARLKQAHLAFLSKVAQLARAEADTLQARIVEPWAGVVAVRREINTIDTGYRQGSAENQEARTSLLEEDRRQVSGLKPLIEARDRALRVVKLAELLASNAYNDRQGLHDTMFSLYRPGSWGVGGGIS